MGNTGMKPAFRATKGPAGGFVLLCVLAAAGLWIFLTELVLAFKAYNPAAGLAGSPWMGMEGFRALFASVQFGAAARNTVTFALLYAVIFFLLGTGIALVVLRLPVIAGDAVAICMLLPAFLPSEVYAQWWIRAMGSGMLTQAGVMRWLLPLICAIRLAGLPAACAPALKDLHGSRMAALSTKVAGWFTLVSLMLGAHSFLSITRLLGNPLTYGATDMLDTSLFRSTFEQMRMTPVSLLQLALNLVAVSLLAVPAGKLARRVLYPEVPAQAYLPGEGIGWKPLSAALGLLLFSCVYFLPQLLSGNVLTSVSAPIAEWLATFPGWGLQAIVAAAISTAIAYALSGALLQASGKLRIPSLLLMLFLTVVSANPTLFSRYLWFRGMGLVNTLWAVMLSGAFSAFAVWAMTALRMESGFSATSPDTGRNMLAVFLVQVAVRWSDGLSAQLYLHDAAASPLMMFRQMMTAGPMVSSKEALDAMMAGLHMSGYWLAFPAMIAALAVYILLPRRKLLAMLAAWHKV